MIFFKNHWIRIFYIIISLVLVKLAFCYKDTIVSDVTVFNLFSYVGVVATLIALLIAISEVIHSISISKGIQEEAKKLLEQAQVIDVASLVSECLVVLDETNGHISGERYILALRSFQDFRRTCLRISGSDFLVYKESNILGQAELLLQQSTHTNAKSPLTKKKRIEIQETILNIKESIEQMNPVKRRG